MTRASSPVKAEKKKRGRPSTASKAESSPVGSPATLNPHTMGMMMPMMMPMMLPMSSSPNASPDKRKRGRVLKKDEAPPMMPMWPFGVPFMPPPATGSPSKPQETKTSPLSLKKKAGGPPGPTSRPRGRPRTRPRPGEAQPRPKQMPLAPAQPLMYGFPPPGFFMPTSQQAVTEQEESSEIPPPPPVKATGKSAKTSSPSSFQPRHKRRSVSQSPSLKHRGAGKAKINPRAASSSPVKKRITGPKSAK